MTAVREVAVVRVSAPVSGLRRARGKDRGQRRKLERYVRLDPAVLKAVRQAKREGERLLIVSSTEAWLVPK